MISTLQARYRRAPPSDGQLALVRALAPWERRLTLEELGRWLLRGAICALLIVIAVLLVGWFVPVPEEDLRPWAFALAPIPLLVTALCALWPRPHVRNAAELDTRLDFGDRLATAWAFRAADEPVTRLQRDDAVAWLSQRPTADLHWRPHRLELIAAGAACVVAMLLLVTPSPQQTVLDQQAAEDLAVQQASQQLDALRETAAASAELSPDQVRQLDELLRQTQTELARTHNQQEASAVVARAADQASQQLGDPNAELRDEALAAMSETLATEPRTRALADALQREDPTAASQALSDMAAQSDQLSDVERQSLSRALQRAANVGRSDPNTSAALGNAAQALASGASPQQSLSQADAALRESMQASQSQAALEATLRQLRDMQTQLASGQPLSTASDGASSQQLASGDAEGGQLASGTPVALDARGSQTVADPSTGQNGRGAGVGSAQSEGAGQPPAANQGSENVFVPGRPGNGQSDQDLVDQPFSVRGAPRPYRDVLNQYAQTSRDYVDRPDISPAVRDLVKQYFQELEQNQ